MRNQQHINIAISQAFYARKYVLTALLNGVDNTAQERPDESLFFSSEGWHLFLRVERCAYPLSSYLQDTGFKTLLPDNFQEILSKEVKWEAKRIASARSQLEEVREWALKNSACPIVLKGGLGILENTPLDLNDIDILLPKSDAIGLFSSLLEYGYYPPSEPARISHNCLWRKGALEVEIHQGIYDGLLYPANGTWPGARETRTCPGLWRLAPEDNVWHLLIHNVDKSPERRGRIRDLLLIRGALDSCSADDIAEIRNKCSGHRFYELLILTLDAALGAFTAQPDDPLEETALLTYLLANRRENRTKVYPTSGVVNRWVYALLAGPVERRQIWGQILKRAEGLSPNRLARWLQLRTPRIARVIMICRRSTRIVLCLFISYLIAIRVRKLRAEYRHYFKARNGRSLRNS